MIKRHTLGVEQWVPDYILEWCQGHYFSENSWFNDEYSVIAKNLCTKNIGKIEKAWKKIVSLDHADESEGAKKACAMVFFRDLIGDGGQARTQYFLDNKENIDKEIYMKWALNGYAVHLAEYDQKRQPMYNEWAHKNNEPILDCMKMSDEEKIKRWVGYAVHRSVKPSNIDEKYLQQFSKKTAELLEMVHSKQELNRIISDILGQKDITIKVPEGQVTRFMNPKKDFLDSLQKIKEKMPGYGAKQVSQKINWGNRNAPLIWLYEEIMGYGSIKQSSAHSLVNTIFDDLGVTIDSDKTDKRKRRTF